MSKEQPEALIDREGLHRDLSRLRGEIAALQQKVEQLDRLAHEDVLVGLPNRRGLLRDLAKLVDRVARYGESAALLFVDIDGLKTINDSHGHPAGDDALVRVSELLLDGVRTSDCVARIGGDEFAVLLLHADEASAQETADRLANLVAECGFRRNGEELPLSVAIGVCIIQGHDSVEEVIARADAEMYRSKLGR